MKIRFPNFFKQIKYKMSLEYIGAFLLIVFCNFWLYKAPIQPFYIFLLASISILSFIFLKNKKIRLKIDKTHIIASICALYLIFLYFIQDTTISVIIHPFFAYIYYILTSIYLNYLKIEQALRITNSLFIFSILYFVSESFWRITHPILYREGSMTFISQEGSFYMFKLNSFIFKDSNAVALILFILFFYSYYLYLTFKFKIYKIFMILLFILICFTLSRAALIFLVISILLFYLFSIIKNNLKYLKNFKVTLKLLIALPFLILLPILGIYVLIYFLSDLSYLTKLQLYVDLIKYLNTISFNDLLFGIGANLDINLKYFDRPTHTLLNTYIVWYGIIGFCLNILLWVSIIIKSNYKASYIIIPIILVGFSLTSPMLSIFYVALAGICYYEKFKKGKNNEKNYLCR